MKIFTFEYIDNAVAVLERDRDNFTEAAGRLASFLEDALESSDEVVGVTDRIKTAASLREKIIRNDLYKQYPAERLIYEMSDIIGVRVECRFLGDEAHVYDTLRKIFSSDAGGGYFCPPDAPDIALEVTAPQPEKQKNGLEIYRIDGYVIMRGVRYNFELQIKSLVNSFWSEIEHKIIYKNKRFVLIDNFVNDMMLSIHDSLVNIDSQLHMIFDRCMRNNVDEQMRQIENILTVLINEVYTELVEEKAGFAVNIKDYAESIVHYILHYSSFRARRSGDDEGNTVMNVMNWMRDIDFDKVDIGGVIELPDNIPYDNAYQRCVGERIAANINGDFYLNTFFHMFFSLEVGNVGEDFLSYIRYFEQRTAAGATPARRVLLKDRVLHTEPSQLVLEKTLEKIRE